MCGAPSNATQHREVHHNKQQNGTEKGHGNDNDTTADGHHQKHPKNEEIETKSHNETHVHNGKRNKESKSVNTTKTSNGSSDKEDNSRDNHSIDMNLSKRN